jgi:hypothetical protein
MTRAPLYIQIALWYHCRANDYEHDGINGPQWPDVVKEFVTDMIDNDILRIAEDDADTNYVMTDKGHAWVDFICKTPFPVYQWVLP